VTPGVRPGGALSAPKPPGFGGGGGDGSPPRQHAASRARPGHREEAAAALGMSLNSFERHVQPTIRLVRLGRMRLVPVAEVNRWLAEHAERAI
jgi:hypothetical protein